MIQGAAMTLEPTAPPFRGRSPDPNLWSRGHVNSPSPRDDHLEASRLLLACWAAVCSWDPGFVATEAWEQVPRVAGEGNEISSVSMCCF